MAEQRVPNLEEMNEQEAHRFLVELFTNMSAQEEYEVRHQDYVMEMPQSGESILGREKMREFQEAYPTPPSIQLRRVLVRDGLWVVEGVNDYGGGQVFDVVLLIELRSGKMWRDRQLLRRAIRGAGVEVPVGRADGILEQFATQMVHVAPSAPHEPLFGRPQKEDSRGPQTGHYQERGRSRLRGEPFVGQALRQAS